jgi:TonB family protein
VPNTIPQPLREIARQCLQVDPQSRCTVHDIIRRLRALTADGAERVAEAQRPRRSPSAWILAAVVLVALLMGAWLSIKVLVNRSEGPAAETESRTPPTPAGVPDKQSPAPFSKAGGLTPGSVLQQVMPEVSRNAQNTITGRLKVTVQVAVDVSGNVSEAKFVSHGPSQYFANKALAAAERWKFNPPQVNGGASASEWMLRFQFSRTSIQVFPAEVKP